MCVLDGFIKSADAGQIVGVTEMGFRKIRVELQATLKLLLCSWPVPVIVEVDLAEGSVRQRQTFI